MTGVLTEAVGGAIGLVVAAMLIGVVDILDPPGPGRPPASHGCSACSW